MCVCVCAHMSVYMFFPSGPGSTLGVDTEKVGRWIDPGSEFSSVGLMEE